MPRNIVLSDQIIDGSSIIDIMSWIKDGSRISWNMREKLLNYIKADSNRAVALLTDMIDMTGEAFINKLQKVAI